MSDSEGLRQAWRDFVLALAASLGIVRLMGWLSRKLGRQDSHR